MQTPNSRRLSALHASAIEQRAQAHCDHLDLASQYTFSNVAAFNSDINGWDTSSVTIMEVRGLPLVPLCSSQLSRRLSALHASAME